MTGIGTVQQPPPYATPVNYGLPPRDSSKKVAAGVFGILLGGFGVHKFILGYTTPGLIMCLVSGLIVVKHHQNIGRLLAGTEYRFGSKKKVVSEPPTDSGKDAE